jgi:hypothetical protein
MTRRGDSGRDAGGVVQKKTQLMPMCVLVSALLLLGFIPDASPAGALSSFEATPVGRWKTVDDVTGKAKSLVVIREERGKISGMIEKILDQSSTDPNPRCGHCQGELKNRPLVGLRILWDLKQDGAQWSGGKVCCACLMTKPASEKMVKILRCMKALH